MELFSVGFIEGPAAKSDYRAYQHGEQDQAKSSELARLKKMRALQSTIASAAGAGGVGMDAGSASAIQSDIEQSAKIEQWNEDLARRIRLSRGKARAKNEVTAKAFGIGLQYANLALAFI